MAKSITLPGLTDARERCGLNQSQLAARLGIHRATICRMERGRATTRPRAYSIARVLGVELDALVTMDAALAREAAADGQARVQPTERAAVPVVPPLVSRAG